ncbi:phosphatidate cytidylyltransferase [Paenibacillus selenitireducens]|uniref:Phosphatidate cytidylyltransferase n=1 Tax=Paenibacillus selenitireducens TaxID=1324314 RepID=A0A1T2XCK0_9BACL|nr:phosphatidate cytidylyltransferase [Paenibacillus selenitireducens]OPA77629.1 phosphatidate cytidylyltransferase [Paenibacillus selenitireducens]
MKQRIITGIIAGIAFLACTVFGGPWYQGLLIVLALIGYYEFVRMNQFKWWSLTSLLGFAGVIYFVFPWKGFEIRFEPYFIWLLMFLFLTITVFSKNRIDIDRIAVMFLGAVYIGIGFQAMIDARYTADDQGLFWTFLLFGCIWASDSGAYFAGRALGKHKLWPSISPNKTIEGALGGVAIAIAVALVFAWYAPELLSFSKAIGIGLAASVVGQLGDLIQSAYKRVRGIKDTGSLLPGHGGVLDRCDSWLIVFPFVQLLALLPYS